MSDDRYPELRYACFVLLLLLLVYTYSFVDRQIISLLVEPIKAQFKISDTQLSVLQGTSFALFYSVLGIPIGMLADRLNRRNLVIAGLLLWSVATVMCGMANSFGALFAGRVAVGVGEACLAPAAYSLISDYFRPEYRGRALTVYTSAIYLGAGLAFIIGGYVIRYAQTSTDSMLGFGGRHAPWQIVFIAVGIAGVALAPVLLLVKEPARHERAAPTRNTNISLREALSFLKSRSAFFTPLMGALACIPIVNYAFFAWTPAMLQRQHHWPVQSTGYAFGSLLLLLGPLGMIAAGYLMDKLGGRNAARFATHVAAFGAAAAIPSALTAGLSSNDVVCLAGLGGFIFFMALPTTIAPFIIQLIVPNELRGTSISLYVLIANLAGYGIGPSAAAIISDRLPAANHRIGFAMALMAAVLLPVAVSLLMRSARKLPTRSVN